MHGLKINAWAVTACIVTASSFVSTNAAAGGLDGTSDIICSVTDVVGCVDNGGCVEGRSSDFDLSDFIIVDAKKKLVRASDQSGHNAVSPIKNMEKDGTHLILQGVENSRGWSIAIDTKNGDMRGSGVGKGLGFLVSGACTSI